MSAYVIANIDIHDPEGYEAYKKLAAPTLAPFGGSYVVRGAEIGHLEGRWTPKRPGSEMSLVRGA
jgi:uncharacterized protein (DUF1330 family)